MGIARIMLLVLVVVLLVFAALFIIDPMIGLLAMVCANMIGIGVWFATAIFKGPLWIFKAAGEWVSEIIDDD